MSKEFTQAQERTNPVFMTAKTAICLMAKAELAGAEAIVRALGLENNEPLQEMPDEETFPVLWQRRKLSWPGTE